MPEPALPGGLSFSSSGRPVLVAGKSGQLAMALARHGGGRIRLAGRPELDFDHTATLDRAIAAINPVAVVNAAAWTAVDLAESEPDAAARANTDGPRHLARLCAARNIPFIHISTDYVFDGEKGAPYLETDPISPRTVYGRTKADGERAVMVANPSSTILRTSWVYSPDGKNFVRTMLQAGARHFTLRVVADQKGNPTSADDLALAVLAILATIERTGWKDTYAGLFHACGTGETTWHGLAEHTLQEAARYGGQPMPQVIPISTRDWPTPAPRPADSRMDTAKLRRVFGVTLPPWQESVSRVVQDVFTHQAGQ